MAVQLLQCEVNRSTVCDGRGLFAYVPMAPGTEIVRVPPFATVLFSEMVDSLCSACMTDQSVDKRCSACKQVRYCGIECQKKDWAEHHKAECKLYAHMPNRLNLQVRLTVRVMNRVLRQGMVPEALASLQPRPYRGKEDEQQVYMRARLLSELVPEVLKQGLLTVATVARLILQIECNAHTIVDKDGIGSVGLGLYLNEGAAINHSCSPNVVISFSRGVLVLRNVVDLLPKTELLIAYTDVTETTPRRQVELENNYDFQCKCKRCTIDLEASGLQRPLFINAEHVLCPGKSCTGTLFLVDGVDTECTQCGTTLSAFEAPFKRLRDAKKQVDTVRPRLGAANDMLDEDIAALRLCLQLFGRWRPHNSFDYVDTLCQLSQALVLKEKYDEAIECSIKAVEGYNQLFPWHPTIGTELARQGQLLVLKGDNDTGKTKLIQALRILSTLYGSHHPIVQMLNTGIWELENGQNQGESGRPRKLLH